MSMHKPLLGEKIAVLVANGFNERDLTGLQRALMPLGAAVRIISMDQGLVNSWNNDIWGLNFAADKALNTALAADFLMLMVPGGQRSIEKLKLTAHTRRFISGFMDTGKPVVVVDDAIDLLVFAEKIKGWTVSGPEKMKDAVEAAGGIWSDKSFEIDRNLMTGVAVEGQMAAYIEAVCAFLIANKDTVAKAA